MTTIVLDGQFSPGVCAMLSRALPTYDFKSLFSFGLREASDATVFAFAREHRYVLMTKDKDFIDMHERQGVPPSMLFVTIGNRRNATLFEELMRHLPVALDKLQDQGLVYLP